MKSGADAERTMPASRTEPGLSRCVCWWRCDSFSSDFVVNFVDFCLAGVVVVVTHDARCSAAPVTARAVRLCASSKISPSRAKSRARPDLLFDDRNPRRALFLPIGALRRRPVRPSCACAELARAHNLQVDLRPVAHCDARSRVKTAW